MDPTHQNANTTILMRANPLPIPLANSRPHCGHKYVGASATGKLRRYRYYTCYSRARYGRSGCQAARIDADHLDTAVTQAQVDFYARTDLITKAVTAAAALQNETADQHTAELDTITRRSRPPNRPSTAT